MPLDETTPVATQRRTIVATTIGNALEFFDFTVYGFLTVIIGKLFFPIANPSGQLLLAVATFGVGFVMRPIGGIVIGAYADRAGRKKAMTLTIALMAIGCGIIAVTPTYAQIGAIAPVLILLARLLQGFSAGGEVGASTTLLVEHGSSTTRGYLASWQFASQGLGIFVGAMTVGLLTAWLGQEQMMEWGWRVPFFFGLLIAPVGMYIRRQLHDSHEVDLGAVKSQPRRSSLAIIWTNHKRALAAGLLLAAGGTSAAYVVTFYLPTYAVRQLGLPPVIALTSAGLIGLLGFLLSPLVGRWSDRVGRKSLILGSRVVLIVLIVPAFLWLVAAPSAERLLAVMTLLGVVLVVQTVPGITMMPELFPRAVRASGMSLIYSLGVSVFGGFSPFINTWLQSMTTNKLVPAYYLIVMTVISLFGILLFEDKTGKEID